MRWIVLLGCVITTPVVAQTCTPALRGSWAAASADLVRQNQRLNHARAMAERVPTQEACAAARQFVAAVAVARNYFPACEPQFANGVLARMEASVQRAARDAGHCRRLGL